MRLPRLAAVLSCALLVASCGGARVDITTALEVTDLTTGWYDAGIVGGLNKLVPSIGFRLRNVSGTSLRNVQLNAVFRRVGEEEEWGASYLRAITGEGLAPGTASDEVILRSNLGYTSDEPRAVMLDHSQFKDVHVEVFAKYGSAQWASLGDWAIERVMLTR